MKNIHILILFNVFFLASIVQAQQSIARQWNEKVLLAISNDFARPTVHARNLFHTSIAMYDAWAIYDGHADTYLLGKTRNGYTCPYRTTPAPADVKAAQNEAISFAVYRLLKHRFAKSPGAPKLFPEINALMATLGYDTTFTSTNYKCCPAALGNYIAKSLIEYGLQDGSNEANDYVNQYYKPTNLPLTVELPGNPDISDLNRWQPLKFPVFVDQSGHATTNAVPAFLGAEWGNVAPFALKAEDATRFQRDGHDYVVYHDPGAFPRMGNGGLEDEYKWNFALVPVWASLLDPKDSVKMDISPASIGNVSQYPTDLAGLHDFYNFFEGGDPGKGRAVNPKTGLPYAPQIVPRGDYTRVLAEFWADGPKSVTPPGHWFEILNYVSDQPGLQKRVRGTGPLCADLEWDVKAYFALGGAMHDAAITAWGIKGWYDGIRPVSAIRVMAERGQSSDPSLPHYSPQGLPLIPGYIELIQAGDSLQGPGGLYIGEVKMKTWKGPNYIRDPKKDVAGVGWIRANVWWPYQRPSFVTPPFAGYISGHSTYSRAAAELLTALTGDPYFPGGMGEFHCTKNEYLVFEDGPSQDITLQWASYRDASDQCSLSRIYGGIHPPMDDIPGRLIGMKIGPDALNYAEQFFTKTNTTPDSSYAFRIFPNPASCAAQVECDYDGALPVQIYFSDGRFVGATTLQFNENRALLDLRNMPNGVFVLVGQDEKGNRVFREKLVVLTP